MSRWPFAPLLALAAWMPALPVLAQETSAPQVQTAPIAVPQEPILFARTLQFFRTTPISIAPFGYFLPAQCDGSGRMYFESGTPPSRENAYFSIGPDGTGQVVYRIPQDLDNEPHNGAFYAESSGKVDLLVSLPGSSLTWLRYDADGNLKSRTKLDAPLDVTLVNFAVTDSGHLFLLAVHPRQTKPSEDSGKTWRALFSPAGDLVATMPAVAQKDPSALPGERVTAASDKFYWASDHSIVVMDTTGTVERELALHKPDEKDRVSGLQISGNMAEITLMHVKQDGHNLAASYLVLDLTTGNPYGLYLQPDEGPHTFTCFDSSRGFTFLGAVNQRLILGEALLP
jgi:YD repeat-containing protein